MSLDVIRAFDGSVAALPSLETTLIEMNDSLGIG